MSPSRGVRWSALLAVAAGIAAPIAPAMAQSVYSVFDDPSPYLDGTPDPIARSPRLLGMGRLSYVLDDAHNRINMWDLGQNPIGVLDADSSSTLEFGPVTGSGSTVTDRFQADPAYQRQTYAARDFRTYYEGWRRTQNSTYGAVGDWSTARTDLPYNEAIERRSMLGRPNIMPILAGHLPIGKTRRFTYALRGLVATPSNIDHYRLFVANSAGQFLDRDGTQIDPPDFFAPTHTIVHSFGLGAHLGMRVTPDIHVAVGYDAVSHNILGTNDGLRNASEIHEQRPYHVGQASIIGRTGGLEWGADARGWRAKSDQDYVFTTSAGTATDPLEGRGRLLHRVEEGSNLKARVRWAGRRFEIGAGLATAYRKAETTPPPIGEEDSFNHFIDVVFNRDGADTLAVPDSIVHNVVEDRSVEAGGGIAWKSGLHGTVLGVEGHYYVSHHDQELTGIGPKATGWDVRSGVELPLVPMLTVRMGYLYHWQDQDDATRFNETTTNSGTAGFGLHPRDVRWSFDAGYAYEWTRSDFQDPSNTRTSRQRLAGRLRWVF